MRTQLGLIGLLALFLIFPACTRTNHCLHHSGPGGVVTSHNSKKKSIWIASTNATSYPTYWGAMTSETSGCKRNEFFKPTWEWGMLTTEAKQNYIATSFEQLSEEAAVGQGAHLEVLSNMMGCALTARSDFYQFTNRHYTNLFEVTSEGSRKEHAKQLLSRLNQSMAQQPNLARQCIGITYASVQ